MGCIFLNPINATIVIFVSHVIARALKNLIDPDFVCQYLHLVSIVATTSIAAYT